MMIFRRQINVEKYREIPMEQHFICSFVAQDKNLRSMELSSSSRVFKSASGDGCFLFGRVAEERMVREASFFCLEVPRRYRSIMRPDTETICVVSTKFSRNGHREG